MANLIIEMPDDLARDLEGIAAAQRKMVNGEELDLWRSEEVLEALDLCLSCKGCTKDCPVSVDMPTLKAEFLSHHYEGRLRPRHAYAFGLIDKAARLASKAPGLANLLAPVAKRAAGVHPNRHLPEFAPLDGQLSPQVTLFLPPYTGLPSPKRLSPGAGAIESVYGTVAALKGLSRPEEIAARRGLPIEDVAPAAMLRARRDAAAAASAATGAS